MGQALSIFGLSKSKVQPAVDEVPLVAVTPQNYRKPVRVLPFFF